MTSLRHRIAAATAAAVATFATVGMAAPAQADTSTVRISYADLDLATANGRATLDRRIRSAATMVCGYADAGNRYAVAACRAKALSDARKPVLAAIERSGPMRLAAK